MRTSAADSVLKAFGTVLKDCRRAVGLSQEELAFTAGLNRVFISSLESGRKEPGLRTLLKLARGLEIRPSEMLQQAEDLLFAPSPKERRTHAVSNRRRPKLRQVK
jgi:transcriptional regulator with XRE-family HTH domain